LQSALVDQDTQLGERGQQVQELQAAVAASEESGAQTRKEAEEVREQLGKAEFEAGVARTQLQEARCQCDSLAAQVGWFQWSALLRGAEYATQCCYIQHNIQVHLHLASVSRFYMEA
jgi:hypothetical protein